MTHHISSPLPMLWATCRRRGRLHGTSALRALHDAAALHDLVISAGFRNVRVCPTIKATKLPLPVEFVPGHLVALPMAQTVAELAAERRTALLGDITETLRSYVGGDQLTLPAGVHARDGGRLAWDGR